MDVAELYDLYVDKVYKFFYIKCLDREQAEDLTSDTFTRYLQGKHHEVTDSKKYLYGIMRIVWTEFLKDKYRLRIAEVEDIEDFALYSEALIDEFEQQPTAAHRLEPFVARLPEKQRLVLTMRVYRELSVHETAQELGKDSNYVKTTYHRAITNLRKIVGTPYDEEVAL